MSRPLRIEFEHAWYLVSNHGINKQVIFPSDYLRSFFLELLAEAHSLFKLEVGAYCLLDSHYHLLAYTPMANLGRIMRHIGSVFTQRHNRHKKSEGPLFRGRYKATLLDPSAYRSRACQFLHRMPVEAGLVAQPEHYRWSSYRCLNGHTPAPVWLHREQGLSALTCNPLGGGLPGHNCNFDEELQRVFQNKKTGPVLGDLRFRQNVAGLMAGQAIPDKIWGPEWVSQRPTIQRITEAIAEHYAVTCDTITLPLRGTGEMHNARNLAMLLSRELGMCAVRDIAAYFSVNNPNSVSVTLHRLKRRVEHDGQFAEQYLKLKSAAGGNAVTVVT